MENLNNDNFWNPTKQESPQAVALFNEWFEQYKADVFWPELFNAGYEYRGAIAFGKGSFCGILKTAAPNFDALPLELQIGILQRFAQANPVPNFISHRVFRLWNNFGIQKTVAGDYFAALNKLL